MWPLVSCISPTFDRADRHESLYASFDRQRYPYKELVVLDDSPEPSEFFLSLQDRRVRYRHDPTRLSIGSKRNACITASRGSVIAHLDDDDHYAKGYLGCMVQALKDADLVKLSVFNVYNEHDDSKWRWDTRTSGGAQSLISATRRGLCLLVPFGWASTDVSMWGFGFSYVYRRSLWEAVGGFADMNCREDYDFIKRAREVGARLKQVPDCADKVWHTVHKQSTSTVFPQTRLDGPTPTPVTNYAVGAIIGATFGACVGGPFGALVGGSSAAALTGHIVRKAALQGISE